MGAAIPSTPSALLLILSEAPSLTASASPCSVSDTDSSSLLGVTPSGVLDWSMQTLVGGELINNRLGMNQGRVITQMAQTTTSVTTAAGSLLGLDHHPKACISHRSGGRIADPECRALAAETSCDALHTLVKAAHTYSTWLATSVVTNGKG
jgi:hypothetical protein